MIWPGPDVAEACASPRPVESAAMYPMNESLGPTADASPEHADPSVSLTYEPFYGLREKPFSLSADPRFLYRSPAHGPAFDELQAGIRRREGLIVLTGEIGTGKTTLCRSVLQHLDRRTFASFVADPFVAREDLLKTLLVDFGVTSMGDLARGRFNGASRSDLSYPLYEFLDSLVPLQAFAVVVIDEAQNLSLSLLEEIRVLSELERREKLLHVVLVGQPQLRAKLKLSAMRQLDQRVSVRCELTALGASAVAGYVRHRLAVAGRGGSRVEFTPRALNAVHAASSGIPRLINRVCDRALQRAYGSRAMHVDEACVWAAADECGVERAVAVPPPRPVSRPESPPALARPSVPTAPAPPAPKPSTGLVVPAESELSALKQFNAEGASPLRKETSIAPSVRRRRRWMIGTSAAVLVIAASIGAPVWLFSVRSVEDQRLTAPIPAPPPRTLRQPAPLSPPTDAFSPELQKDRAAAASSDAVIAHTSAPEPRGGYTILVASFQSRDRAERVVEDLVNAGYPARAMERAGGPNGRWVQVQISGYTSAIDVQRDLQRVRELPGGFGDARVVEQN